jgi:hypothetical protein
VPRADLRWYVTPFSGLEGAPVSLANVSCACLETGNNNEGCGTSSSRASITWPSDANKTYHIQVTGDVADRSGLFTLDVSGAKSGQTLVGMDAPGTSESMQRTPPSILGTTRRDLTRLADGLPDCVAGPSTSITGNTSGKPSPARRSNPDCPDELGGLVCITGCPSVWHRVVGTGGTMYATTCGPGTVFNARIIVYQGVCSRLSCVAHNDIGGCGSGGTGPLLSWPSTAGAVYQIQVTGFGTGDVGNFTLRVDGTGAPLIQTDCT